MSTAGKFWKEVSKKAKATNPDMVALCQVLSLEPFAFEYRGIDISVQNGDNIFIDPLLLQANIGLDVGSLDSAQNINPALWKADNTPTGTVEISGTQKQFLTDFYNFFKEWQNTYIIAVGDYVTVQKLGNNTYIVIRKVVEIEQ